MKYICYYDTKNHESEKRDYSLSATNKIDYIVSALNKNGVSVELISASRCKGKNTRGRSRLEDIGNRNTLRLFKSRSGRKLTRMFDKVIHSFIFVVWCLLNIKKGETVLCYHSVKYYKLINFLKKVIKFKLILEVEEIYAIVMKNKALKKKEMKYLQIADGYIFVTKMLNDKVNLMNKPYCISHGTYLYEKNRNCRFRDGKIHVVYSGTLNPEKGGSAAAAASAQFLSDEYHVHILGFGTDDQIQQIKKLIDDVNEKSKATITYDGTKTGEEYIAFLQSCDIGLSTQNPNEEFNSTSFPSKILAYLSNGLRVVTVDIPAVRTSDVSNLLYYYKGNNPKEIAEAIMKIDLSSPYDSSQLIKNLDKKFQKDLKTMVEKMG